MHRFVSEKISSEDLPTPLKVQPHPQPIQISSMHSPDHALSQADFLVDLPQAAAVAGKAPETTTIYDYELYARPPTVIHVHESGVEPSRNNRDTISRVSS